MPADHRKARDIALLDAIDALPRERFEGTAWRVTREGRDPLLGGPSNSRWCNATFDALYLSLERNGALAETYALLSEQPVFPSTIRWFGHEVTVRTSQTLRLATMDSLAKLGVDVARYRGRHYGKTQEIADAAYFLGFDGLLAPSARWSCENLVLFSDRVQPADLAVATSDERPIDWQAWRKTANS